MAREPRYCRSCKTYRVYEDGREIEPCACDSVSYPRTEGENEGD